jgi:hypothetical protein
MQSETINFKPMVVSPLRVIWFKLLEFQGGKPPLILPYSSIGPKLEGNLNFFPNGRQPHFFGKWETTSISRIWKTISILWQMEDNLNIFPNGRQPQLFGKWKTNIIIWKIEDNLNYLENGRRPQSSVNGR